MNSRTNPIPKLILAAILGVLILPAASWGQTINVVRRIQVEDQKTQTVLHIPGSRVVNFTAHAVASPPRVQLDLANTRFEDAQTQLEVDDWTISSVQVANLGGTGQPKVRVTVFLARKATYRVETRGQTVSLILVPEQAPPPSTEEAVKKLEQLQRQSRDMEKQIQKAQQESERLKEQGERLQKEARKQQSSLQNQQQDQERMTREREAAARQLNQLTREREAAARQLNQLTMQRQTLSGEMEKLQSQVDAARENEAKARSRMEEIRRNTLELEKKRAQSAAQLEETNRNLQREQTQRQQVEKEIREMRVQIRKLRSEASDSEKSGRRMTQRTREQLASLEKSLSSSEARLKEAQEQVARMEARRQEIIGEQAKEEEKLRILRNNAKLENRKLNSEISTLRSQAGELQAKRDALHKELSSLQSRRDELQKAVERERQLQQELEEARKKEEQLQKQTARLTREELNRSRTTEKRRVELEALLARERQELSRIQEMKKKEADSLSQLRNLRAEHQKLLQQEESRRQQLERQGARSELKRLQERQKQREQEISRLERESRRWETAAKNQEREVQKLSVSLNRARAELETARNQYEEASAELIRISQMRDEARGQLRQTQGQLESMNRQTQAEKKRMEELSAQVARQEQTLKAMDESLRQNRENLQSLEQQRNVKEREVQKLSASARQLADQVRQDQETLKQLDGQKTRIQQQLRELQGQKTDLEKQVSRASRDKAGTSGVKQQQERIRELENRRARLEKDLAALEDTRMTLSKLEQEKVRAQTELSELEQKRLELNRQIDSLGRTRNTRARARRERTRREAEVKELEQRKNQLEKELTRLAEQRVQLETRVEKPKSDRKEAARNVVHEVNEVEFVDSPWSHHVVLHFSSIPGEENLRQDKDKWIVTFPGGVFREDLRRNMDTSAYQGPVSRVLTYNRTTGDNRSAVVEIQTRGSRNVQVRKGTRQVLILVPKTVAEVRSYQKNAAPPAEVGSYQQTTRMAAKNVPAAPRAQTRPRRTVTSRASGGGYSGRFVDLDFKDADLHNVIRLVAEVWGKNVVIPDEVKGTISIKLTNVRVDRAFDVILKSKSLDWVDEGGNIIRIATLDQMQKERDEMMARTKTEVRMIPTETRLIPINYASVEDISKTIETNVMSSRGKVSFDKRTNVIIYVDVPAKIQVAQELVRSLDLPTPQVQIEARIVEAETTFLREIGVQWGGSLLANSATGNPTGLVFPSNIGLAGGNMDQLTNVSGIPSAGAANPDFAVNLPANTGTGAGGALGMTLGSLSGAVNINLRLSAMEEIGHVRSIAAPKITTLDNVEANISQGVEIPYPQSSAQGNTVIMKQAVLSLSVTPHVTNDNYVQMKIEVTKDEPDLTNRGADGSLGISKKSAKTELLVKSGDTAVIGGIYKRQSSLIYRKVPWFADIPIVGWMFKNQYKKDSRSELLIFITPRVLNRSGIITKD